MSQQDILSGVTVLKFLFQRFFDSIHHGFFRHVLFQQFAQRFARPFQILLILFEDDRLIVLLEIKGERIGENQQLATLQQNVEGFFHRLKIVFGDFARRTTNFLGDAFGKFRFQVQRMFVRAIAIVIVQITSELRSVAILRLFVDVRLIEPVALIVFRPVARAEPTEFVMARTAGHVVAAAVLLDVHVTLRTEFRVRFDPEDVLTVVEQFLRPLNQQLTFDRSVPRLTAVEAERRRARVALY